MRPKRGNGRILLFLSEMGLEKARKGYMKRYYFIFSKNNILLEQQPNGTFTIPCAEEVPIGIHPWTHVLNISPMDDGTEVKALMVDDPKSIEATDDQLRMDGWVFKSLRESFYHLPETLYLKAGKCEELLYWDHNTQFCGVCGAPMKMSTDISKRCTQCGKEVWPQLATAVIVLIRKGDEVLLVHARNFASDFYGLVAGFVETGETLEEAVRREVMEETGLTIKTSPTSGRSLGPTLADSWWAIWPTTTRAPYTCNGPNCRRATGFATTRCHAYPKSYLSPVGSSTHGSRATG